MGRTGSGAYADDVDEEDDGERGLRDRSAAAVATAARGAIVHPRLRGGEAVERVPARRLRRTRARTRHEPHGVSARDPSTGTRRSTRGRAHARPPDDRAQIATLLVGAGAPEHRGCAGTRLRRTRTLAWLPARLPACLLACLLARLLARLPAYLARLPARLGPAGRQPSVPGTVSKEPERRERRRTHAHSGTGAPAGGRAAHAADDVAPASRHVCVGAVRAWSAALPPARPAGHPRHPSIALSSSHFGHEDAAPTAPCALHAACAPLPGRTSSAV
jgi:hypothetical protein